MSPIPGGFDRKDAIPHAVNLRVTRSGLNFIQTHAVPVAASLLDKEKDGGKGDGIIEFRVPNKNLGPLGLDLCPKGSADTNCIAKIDLNDAELRIDGVAPTATLPNAALRIAAKIPLVVDNLPIKGGDGLFYVGIGKGKGANGVGCEFSKSASTPKVESVKIPVEIIVPLMAETNPSRKDYTRLDLEHLTVRTGVVPQNIHACNTTCWGKVDAIVDCPEGSAPDCVCKANYASYANDFSYLLTEGLPDLLAVIDLPKALAGALCENTNCPEGSTLDSADGGTGVCQYNPPTNATAGAPKTCVAKPLGLQGNIDVGSFISKFAPGNTANFDVLAAIGGDLGADGNVLPKGATAADPINVGAGTAKGVTISTVAGLVEPPARPGLPKGVPPCVVDDFANPIPSNIAIPDALKDDPANTHAAISVSESFLKYGINSLYKQCVFTLGVTTETLPVLNSGLLSAFSGSLRNLAQETKPAALAIVTRPSKPPTISLGGGTNKDTDPLLLLALPKLSLDIYVWSSDRFVRAFTWTADVEIPLSVQTGVADTKLLGGLMPVLGTMRIANSSVTNSDLLLEDPKLISDRLVKTLPGVIGQTLGKIPPIDINAQLTALGLALDLPTNALRTITQGNEKYLGVFASLAVPEDNPPVTTEATLLDKSVDADAMRPEVLDEKRMPVLRTRFATPGTNPGDVEYSYWIDEGTRSAWSSKADVDISNSYLFFQGKHELKVTSRLRGRTLTEDRTPSVIPFIIDTVAPKVTVKELGRTIEVDAWDYVSKEENLTARYRITNKEGGGSWTDWMPFPKVASLQASQSYGHIDVEVRDEEGNVGTTDKALVRGVDAEDHGSCACSTPGHDSGYQGGRDTAMFVGGLLVLGLLVVRRRRVRISPALLSFAGFAGFAGLAGVTQGCSDSVDKNPAKETLPDGGEVETQEGCSKDPLEPLSMGIIGAYTSAAKTADGTIWVAGYNDAAVEDGQAVLYGDLVVGKFDKSSNKVAWQTVDGLPPPRTDGSCPTNDPNGWRKGEEDPGDNVGLWTSMQVNDAGKPIVSYFDQTNGALKFATFDGTAWKTHTIVKGKEPGGQAGRYSKLLIADGKPAIAFLTIEATDKGRTRSKVQVARAKSGTPAANGDWTIEDVFADESGACQPSFCTKSQVCAPKTTNAAGKPVLDCIATAPAASCKDCTGNDKACALVDEKPTCVTKAAEETAIARPKVAGTDLAFATGPNNSLAIVALDQINGDLVGTSYDAGKWQKPVILDGSPTSKVDFGVGTALTVSTKGDWLVTYARGFVEALTYLYLPGGLSAAATTPTPLTIDPGMGLPAGTFTDGKHRVGDDSSINLGTDGALSVVYQDATAGTLRVAKCTKATDCAKDPKAWVLSTVEQKGKFAGFFPRRIDDQIINWWRKSDQSAESMTGDVALVPLTN